MSEAKEIDRLYFEANPSAFSYDRMPLPHEWADVEFPAEAKVSVYRINATSRVRALQLDGGERLAPPILDVDAEEKKTKTIWGGGRKKVAAS